MKRKLPILAALLALAAASIAWYVWGPATAPVGQEPLLALTTENLEQFRAEFNAASDRPRIVALLSPT